MSGSRAHARGSRDHGPTNQVRGEPVDVDAETTVPAPVADGTQAAEHRLSLVDPGWAALRPTPGFERPLIVTTVGWFSTARLAHALTEAGFAVSACRPRGHAMGLVDGLVHDLRLSRARPLRALLAAIRLARPDIVLPDDERALSLLRRLHSRMQTDDPEIAALVARSLGNVDDWSTIGSRAGLTEETLMLGGSAPETRVIENADSLATWVAEQSPPIVLKTDGSWGGRGVAIVHAPSDVQEAWRRISRPPGTIRTITRAVLMSDDSLLESWMLRRRPVVNAQRFVSGRNAMATVACLEGEVLAIVCLEVIQASEAKGPASVVRIIDHRGMAATAGRLVDRFRLSGFFGLDFIITDDGDAQLLELNARVTPTCHLLLDEAHSPDRTIGLFPTELIRSTYAGTEVTDVLDVPENAPLLIQAGERMAVRKRRMRSRVADGLTKKFSARRY